MTIIKENSDMKIHPTNMRPLALTHSVFVQIGHQQLEWIWIKPKNKEKICCNCNEKRNVRKEVSVKKFILLFQQVKIQSRLNDSEYEGQV